MTLVQRVSKDEAAKVADLDQTLLHKARTLAPTLRERAAATNRARRVPEGHSPALPAASCPFTGGAGRPEPGRRLLVRVRRLGAGW